MRLLKSEFTNIDVSECKINATNIKLEITREKLDSNSHPGARLLLNELRSNIKSLNDVSKQLRHLNSDLRNITHKKI